MSTKRFKGVKPDWTRTRNNNYVSAFSGLYTNKSVVLATGAVNFDIATHRIGLRTQVDTMVDTVSPGYAQRVAAGEIINHPMTKAKTTYSSSDGGYALRITSGGSQQDYVESRAFPLLWPAVQHLPHGLNVTNAVAFAQTKCLSNIKTSSMMGIVSVAELGKTFRMILRPLQAVAPLLTFLAQQRKANVNLAISSRGRTLTVNGRKFARPSYQYAGPGKLASAPRTSIIVPAGAAISGAVLANNLGLRPLMMDLDALLKEIPRLHQSKRLTFRASAEADSSVSDSSTVSNGTLSVATTITSATKLKVRCTALVEERFDIPSDFGVSLDDIPEAAWELIPYSFVVDYFVNVGDVLGAARAKRQYNILAFSTVTALDQTTTRTTGKTTPVTPWVVIRALSGGDSLNDITKTRSVEIPQPSFAYTPSNVFRPTVVQNLLSLTVQQLAGLNTGKNRTFY